MLSNYGLVIFCPKVGIPNEHPSILDSMGHSVDRMPPVHTHKGDRKMTKYQLHVVNDDYTGVNALQVSAPCSLQQCHSALHIAEGNDGFISGSVLPYHPEPADVMGRFLKVWTWFMIPLGVLFVCRMLWIAAHWNR